MPLEEQEGGIPVVGVIVAVLLALGIAGTIYYSWRRT